MKKNRKLIYLEDSYQFQKAGWTLGKWFWKEIRGKRRRVRYAYKSQDNSGFKQPSYNRNFGRLF